MRITGVIKTSYISQGHSFAANKGLTIKVSRVITGSIVVEFQDPEESDTLEKVYSWFQETSGTGKAPFPDGTLLGYSIHDEEKKPVANKEEKSYRCHCGCNGSKAVSPESELEVLQGVTRCCYCGSKNLTPKDFWEATAQDDKSNSALLAEVGCNNCHRSFFR